MGFSRREILKGLISLPVFGVFFYQFFKKRAIDLDTRDQILSELKLEEEIKA